ncbi:MAG TPA: hypothetical protein VHN81_10520 [Edaphobacter sp.]|nr:hypothetical protein [Edaphobacter sp.]
MTKLLSIVSVATLSVALQAQSTASPQASAPGATSGTTQTMGSQPQAISDAGNTQAAQKAGQVQAASVSAELTKRLDSKKAKVGDEVEAKTTDEAKLPDGTDLPKGTKLKGNVIDVKAKSKEQNESHMVISLNRAELKGGKELPIRAAVTSMTAPTVNASMDMPAGGAMAGPIGGGAAAPAAATGASPAGSAAPMPSQPTMATSGNISSSSSPAQSTPGPMLKSATDRVPVGNKPKVMLSAPTTPDSASVLDAQGDNISLDSGTKMTVNIASAESTNLRQ